MSIEVLKFKEYLMEQKTGISPVYGYAPQVQRQGTIVIHDYHKTPIHIQLSDGTQLYLTRQQYESIGGGKPERGATMEVTLQRHPLDKTGVPSQIVKAVVIPKTPG